MVSTLGKGTIVLLLCFPMGCASSYSQAFPQEVLQSIDSSLTFLQLKESPVSHQGRVVLLGGEILSAKRHKDQTRLIVLQLPLTEYQDPNWERTQSHGRFIAFQKEFLDPATTPPGTRITLIGQIQGETMEMLGEMEYSYPTLAIKHLRVWAEPREGFYPYGWYGQPHYHYDPYWHAPYYYAGPNYCCLYGYPSGQMYRPHPYWW